MTEDDIIEHGKAVFEQCYHGIVPTPEQVPPKSFGELNLKMFHEIWGDDRLTMRDRRLAVFGILAGRGGDPSLFGIHVRSALRNKEFTPEELRTLMRLFCYYAGAPQASVLYLTLETILKETDEGATA